MNTVHRYPPPVEQPAPAWRLDDDQRLAALAGVEVVPGVVDPLFEPYVRLVTRMLGVPVSLVSFVTAHQQIFAAGTGLPEPWSSRGETPLDMSFCQHVVTDDQPLQVDDAPEHPRVRTNLAIPVLGVQAYLGVPLRAPAGEPLGSLCAIDSRPRTWTSDDLETLQDIGDAASAAIALRISEHRQRADAHDASHRLRTPITGLRLELEELAAHPGLDADVEIGVRAAHDRLDDLSTIVDGLMESARSRRQEREEDVDIVKVTASVAERRRLAGLGEQVTHVAGPPVVIRTVPGAVRRIVELLVADVLDHADVVRLEAALAGGTAQIEVTATEAGRTLAPGAAGSDALAVAKQIAAGIGARISPFRGTVGYEVHLAAPRSLPA